MKTTTLLGRRVKNPLSLLLTFLMSSHGIYSQSFEECITPDDNSPDSPGMYSYSADPAVKDTLAPQVVNFFFWGIRDANGNSSNPLTEYKALEAIAYINQEFNPHKIYLKYRGFHQVDSPPNIPEVYYDDGDCPTTGNIDADGYSILGRCQIPDLRNYMTNNNYLKDDAINIIVPAGMDDFGGAASGRTIQYVPTGGLTGKTFIHELGHNFGLAHTHQGFRSVSNCERVTRDPSDPNFNADRAGDKITDTAALPDFKNEYCFENGLPTSDCSTSSGFAFYYIDQTTCTYTGNGEDCGGGDPDDATPYDIKQADVQNHMGYANPDCRNQFSTGQSIRMLETIANNSAFANRKAPIAALYEPYKGEYYEAGPLPTEPPLFQPGFDYAFLDCDCDCPQPSPWIDTSFSYGSYSLLSISADETDYSLITHPNHSAIAILNLPDHPTVGQKTRRCYDNDNRNAKDGSVTRFHDGVVNANYTTTTKDSLQINDPQLVPQLPQGLYLIEKNFEDGSTEDTMLYKQTPENE